MSTEFFIYTYISYIYILYHIDISFEFCDVSFSCICEIWIVESGILILHLKHRETCLRANAAQIRSNSVVAVPPACFM